ncbi:anti-sigma-K factor RskA [Rhizobium sp. SG_E_25_P2]|jgi:anti-sigma-K factor RskA|uniref:anti-sigma factor n=1 Tax=Rhizobium sp. SG_E_25_P2 TaxID=2879942 RepID=UPI002474B29F|nr:anti-sigma factor [Rhizobium sp. SG_E_25_P2]MDH6264969.1 anti-sigma-K factor RskA [Rhizobium sp. SG_E_25_P2]
MSEKPQDWDRGRDEIISGEYVLGVLSEADRKRVEARMATDAKFAMQVRRWQTNLADFNDDYEAAPPPSHVFRRIEAQLFEDERANGASLTSRAWNSLLLWRGLAVAGVLAAAWIGLAPRLQPLGPGQPPRPLVAELTSEKNGFNLVATYDFGTGRLSVIPAALRQNGPKSLEVWVIEDGKPPLSVGVLPETGRGDIVIPTSLRASFTAGRTIAITVEPLGGSPDGKPTGPVIAAGRAVTL